MPNKQSGTGAKKAGASKSAAKKKNLVIVESPAKAKTISKFLGASYKVEASNGHVRDLPKSQFGVSLDENFEPKYITIRGRGDIVDRIRKEAKSANKIYLATDPDREGEAISWHLSKLLGLDEKQASRIVFNEITKQAVKSSIKGARPIDMSLVDAQQARRVLDRLVGYSISPLLWERVKKGLSAGRVQSVAVRMICDREDEIESFIPQEYWHIGVTLKKDGMAGKVNARYSSGDLSNEKEAQDVLSSIEGKPFIVEAVKKGTRKRSAPAPFTTSMLQQEAARKLGFTTKRTMLIAQQLYEGVDLASGGATGLISYIRTDSVRVAAEALTQVREYISATYGEATLPEKPNEHKGRGRNTQDAHEAIRPVSLEHHPESVKGSLTRDQYRLYKLVFERFVASQMKPALYETMNVQIKAGDADFKASGSRVLEAGYMSVYTEQGDDEKDVILPQLNVGEVLEKENGPNAEQHFTQPPARFNEAMLVRTLEDNGIGRPSTYAPIISTIIDRGYVMRQDKALRPTELGVIVTGLMKEYFDTIVDEEFTADLEKKLDEVEDGILDWREVLKTFYGPFSDMLEHAQSTMEKVEVKDEISDVICENCGSNMVIKMGRYGKFLACPNFPECRNTKPLEEPLGVPCPKCGGSVIRRRTKKGRYFFGCDKYPECDFVSWDQPVKEKCPECGSMMVRKGRATDTVLLKCTNDECGHSYKAEVAPDEQ